MQGPLKIHKVAKLHWCSRIFVCEDPFFTLMNDLSLLMCRFKKSDIHLLTMCCMQQHEKLVSCGVMFQDASIIFDYFGSFKFSIRLHHLTSFDII